MEGLHLTRKVGQKILIGEDVVVTIKQVRGNRVTVNVQAPRDKKILREELRAA